ncbi:MAG: diguanylate phosphodiesterase [Alphaproteobacteria bacterium]|nr:diguanylate phosphodiesterase [Alphaproteobacteria bacterium]HCQ71325.1 diguanylate phosphodiesterase [Rhodospirillaceae bacterium]|tara:strand:- start:35740 stop:37368 length:1629 start_codon:yes stop_codon:yes gene_type:complete
MSNDSATIKKQRDRFLAFSFASADLLLEIKDDDFILSALGATKNLIGMTDAAIKECRWYDIFTLEDQSYLKQSVEQAVVGQRIGPFFVELNHNKRKVLFSCIKMPQSNVFYATVGLSNNLEDMIFKPAEDQANITLPGKEDLSTALEEKLLVANSLNKDADITFLDLGSHTAYKERVGKETWAKVSNEIAASISKTSLGGDAAGKIADNKYTLLHERNADIEGIKQYITDLMISNDPHGEGLDIKEKTIAADTTTMSPKQAAHSLLYTLNEFERRGAKLEINDIKQGFTSYMDANSEKIKELETFINTKRFDLYFQPIVELSTGELSHYEVLSRFNYGSTQEWIMFCEDVGMAIDFDLAVADKVLNYIHYKAGTTNTKFAMNISGQSIADEGFFNRLSALLMKYDNVHTRLSFEITESYHIEDLKSVASYIDQIRALGFKVSLDDFGAGSASLQYLQELNVDCVKIDGKYIRNIRESQRDITIVKNITNMCLDLGIDVVAEYVEDYDLVKTLRKLGIQYGQGFYYSRPRPAPDYINKTQSAA